jgi:hypothetical protein
MKAAKLIILKLLLKNHNKNSKNKNSKTIKLEIQTKDLKQLK